MVKQTLWKATRCDGTDFYTGTVSHLDALANLIRQVDGNHSLGAGALAEALWAKGVRVEGNEPEMPGLIQGQQHNRWLPGEQGRSGVYADDNCEGGFLKVFQDEQGDVWLSAWENPMPMVSIRFVANCSRRPHVLLAARQLARALAQEAQ